MHSDADQTPAVRPHEAVTFLLVTWLCLRAFWWASARAGRMLDVVSFEALLKLALWLPPCLVVVWLIRRRTGRAAGIELGMGKGLRRGLGFGAAATIPMLIAVALLPKEPFDPDLVVGSAIVGPIAEEVLFRGFLFTLLVRRAGWSLPVALIVSSVVFGLAHVRNVDLDLWAMSQGPNPQHFEWGSQGGVLVYLASGHEVWWRHLTTRLPMILSRGLPYAAGGAIFAWVTYRWNSLWPAIALHGFMNLWWDMTRGEHAQLVVDLDPLAAAQGLSVALAIWLTIRWTRRATPLAEQRDLRQFDSSIPK